MVVGGTIMAACSLSLYVLIALSVWNFSTLSTAAGYPLTADFALYWTASKLALCGKAALAYNVNELHAAQIQLFGPHYRFGAATGWFYPPYYFLVGVPFALLPYVYSLIIWITVTFIIYLIILSRLSPHPIFMPLCITFPGILENIIFGQNGFLSGTLLGGGLLFLDRRPVIAGLFFGLMSYKPNLLILTVIALMFGCYWKTLISTIVTFLILVLLSIVIFGYPVWMAYFEKISIPMKLLASGVVPLSVVPTFFSAILSAGFGVKVAYIVQGAVMLAVMVGVIWVWGKGLPLAIRGAVLLLGTILFTPYAFTYDLAILALALGWLWEDGRLHGRLPGELTLLGLGWFMPVAVPYVWELIKLHQVRLQIGPEILFGLFLLALIKARIAQKGQERPG